ncbi:hypothetical protein L511_1416 [Bordetella bronchiseptica MBORD595]|nr:hypothetical protein L511_1416 [Bordetella bronchiseptica MBORD595]
MLGHDGALAWVESVLLAPAAAPPPPAASGSAPAEAARLDARVRALFDPDGVLAARAGSGAVGAKGRE